MMANGPGQPTTPGGGACRSDDALQRPVYALNNQNPSEAQRIAGDILKAEPRHAQALYVLGCALLMQGRAEDAITPLETAARGRHDPAIDTQLAIALRQAGRTTRSLASSARPSGSRLMQRPIMNSAVSWLPWSAMTRRSRRSVAGSISHR
jgi:cytochrome c-type biogenesis protein CcmH/NrfG